MYPIVLYSNSISINPSTHLSAPRQRASQKTSKSSLLPSSIWIFLPNLLIPMIPKRARSPSLDNLLRNILLPRLPPLRHHRRTASCQTPRRVVDLSDAGDGSAALDQGYDLGEAVGVGRAGLGAGCGGCGRGGEGGRVRGSACEGH